MPPRTQSFPSCAICPGAPNLRNQRRMRRVTVAGKRVTPAPKTRHWPGIGRSVPLCLPQNRFLEPKGRHRFFRSVAAARLRRLPPPGPRRKRRRARPRKLPPSRPPDDASRPSPPIRWAGPPWAESAAPGAAFPADGGGPTTPGATSTPPCSHPPSSDHRSTPAGALRASSCSTAIRESSRGTPVRRSCRKDSVQSGCCSLETRSTPGASAAPRDR